jgi:hypothetical protein
VNIIGTYPTVALQLGTHWSPSRNFAHEIQSVGSAPQHPSTEHWLLQTSPVFLQFSSGQLLEICSSRGFCIMFFQMMVWAKHNSLFSRIVTAPDLRDFRALMCNARRDVFTMYSDEKKSAFSRPPIISKFLLTQEKKIRI